MRLEGSVRLVHVQNTANTPSDAVLMRAIKTGDAHAFKKIVALYHRRFYSLAYRFLLHREDAEDIVQEAFTRLWQKSHQWDEAKGAAFQTWFGRIVLNLCRDAGRKRRHMPIMLDTEHVTLWSNDLSPEQALITQQVLKLLNQLPTRQREAVILCYYEGYTQSEAATMLDVTVKALESLLSHAKSHLQKEYTL